MEGWTDYSISPNDIDTARLFEATADMFPLFLLEEEEDGSIPLNSSVFGAKVYRHRNLLQKKAWYDLNLDPLRSESCVKKLPDLQILRLVHQTETGLCDANLNDFLSNGYNADPDPHSDMLAENASNDDIWLNTTSEYLANHTFSNMKMRQSSTFGQHSTYALGAQTPRLGRRRSSQEKFQTPITRIR